MHYRVLIFDLDGTLADSFPAIHESLAKAMKETGLPPWDLPETKKHVGHGIEHLVESAVGNERKTRALEIFRQDYGAFCQERTYLFPHVSRVLSELEAAGFRLAVATNKPLVFTNRILQHLGILDQFTCIMGPERVTHRKPHPDMINAIRSQLGVEAKACLYVGDMPLDTETASEAGVDCLLVATGAFPFSRLKSEVPVPVLEDFSEIPGFLRSIAEC